MDKARPRARRASVIKPREDRRFVGIGMVLVAYLMFTGIDTSAKWLTLTGMPSAEVVFIRYGINLILILGWFVPMQGLTMFRTRSPWLEVARGLALLLSTVFNFIAVRYLPLTVTGSIMFSMPLIVCALSIPILGEQVGWRRWAAILVGLGGVLIIVRPGGNGFQWQTIFSLGAVVSYALYNIFNRKLAGVDSPFTQQIYSVLLATLCVMPFALGQWVWPINSAGWLAFFAMGVFGLLGHLLISTAHRLAEASTLAPFIYPQILYMTASSWFVFGQAPDVWIFVGAPIVIGSGFYIWLRERQLAEVPAKPVGL